MDQYNEILDLAHCLRKEIEYYEKAANATDERLKTTYEAAAREFRYRASLAQKNKNV